MIVTAEPYFAVQQPSELVVLENELRADTKGKIFEVSDYKLMKRSQYQKMGNPLALSLDLKHVPLEMYEARNAVEIAKNHKANQYAAEIFSKAEESLKMAEDALAQKANKKEIISRARETAQFSEDARSLAAQRQEEQRIALEKADAAAEQDALRAKEEAARAEAERARQEAEKAEREKQELRASLLDQFNRILETRDTPRGLVVTMADVLFDTGKYELRPAAREKLARLSGIVLAHPGLNLQVEGHTDSTGSDEFNQKLSEQRANSTREYLIKQGLAEANVAAAGFGKTMPVAENATAAGRQKNRRVEIIVGGEVIGAKIGK